MSKFLSVAALVAACALLGASQARPAGSTSTATSLHMSATTIAPSTGTVTLTATVTGSAAPPTGNIDFSSKQSGFASNLLATQPLSPINATQSQATFDATGFSGGTYTIGARYRSDDSSNFSSSSAVGQFLTVTSIVVHNTSMTLATNPVTLNDGDFTDLVAHVTESDSGGITPTGTVSFHGAGASLIGTAELDGSGTATLTHTGPWLAGTYTIDASYEGDIFDHAASASITISVGNGGVVLKDTTTTIIASPVSIHTGDTVTLDATVIQTGTSQHPPAGDAVEFRGNGIFLGQTNLGSDGHAVITVGGWLSGNYTIEAHYVGNLFFKGSAGQTTLAVSDPLPTSTTYTGDTSASYGGPVTLKAVLIDRSTGRPFGGQTVAISVAAGEPGVTPLTCTGTTDSSGLVQCSTTMTLLPGSYPIAAAYAGSGAYLASGDNATMVVLPINTTTTASNVSTTTGTPTTISGHLVDQWGHPLPAGTSVMLQAGAENCTGTTDAAGNVSCQITPSEGTGSYPIVATFAGLFESDGVTPFYLGSSGPAVMTIVGGIPTLIPYTGDTTVQQGSSAHISFVLKNQNTNALLPNEPVTVTFDGQTFDLTSDGSGVVQTDVVVHDPAGSNLPATASFDGDPPYFASSGSGSVFVTAPTTLTYTGPSVVTEGSNGGNTTISFVLKDGQGNVLAGQTVNLALGSQTCNGLTTDANGSVSCLVTTPAPGIDGGYTPTASFAGTPSYGPSNGPGSFIVVAPTNLTYTGDTTGTRGGIATLKGVLTDAVTGLPLAGRTVTWTIGTGPTAQSCTAITDSAGLASCTVTLSQNASTTPYAVSGAFTGSTYYGPSTAAGALTIAPTPLTVTADNQSMTQGGAVPPLTYKVTGFINGDTLATSDVTGTASCSTTATSSSPVGVYPIVCTIGSLASTNYTFVFVPGQISILPPLGCDKLFLHANKCESVIADPSAPQGAQVTPGQTMSVVYTDDSAMPAGGATVSVNGQLIPITVTTTSGNPQNYVDSYNGSMSTKYQSLISFQVPANLANGQYSFIITVYDGDGDGDQWSWNIGIGQPGQSGTGGGTGTNVPGCTTVFAGKTCESVIADPSPAQSAQVTAGQTMTFVYTDDSAMPAGGATVTLNGQQLPLTITTTSGQPQNYVDTYKGSLSAKYQSLVSFKVPAGLANGQYSFIVVVHDGDGDGDVWAWNVGIGMPGANGGSGTNTGGTAASMSLADPGSMLLVNKAVKLTATLTSGGKGINKETVTFAFTYDDASLGVVTCTATTNTGGVATCPLTPTALGQGDLTASFDGDGTYTFAGDGQDATIVSAYPTTLTLGTVPAFTVGTAVAVSASIASADGTVPPGNVTFTLGGASCSAKPSPSGVASCKINPKADGALTLTASYAGDPTHAAASVSQAVAVSAAAPPAPKK